MRTDEKVELAQRIAGQLVGIVISEWNKWCSYAKHYGLDRALQCARALQVSPSLRSNQQETYRKILDVLTNEYRDLKSLGPQDLSEVFGYIGRWLIAWRETSGGEGSAK